MAMDETSCRGRTKHRTSEERTPVGTQSAEGYCRKCDQRDPGSRRDELPEAPESFLAHFSVLDNAGMERLDRSQRPGTSKCSTSICLKITFSGSTNEVYRHGRPSGQIVPTPCRSQSGNHDDLSLFGLCSYQLQASQVTI